MISPNFDYARAAYIEAHTGYAGAIGPAWETLSLYEQARFARMYDVGRRDALPELLARLPEDKMRELVKPYDLGLIRANSELLGRAMTAEALVRELRKKLSDFAAELARLGNEHGT